MTAPQETPPPTWSLRLASELTANDQAAQSLAANFTEHQLNWQPDPTKWSVDQCLEHLCKTNEAYMHSIDAAIEEKPLSPVDEITPGWFGRWFIRSFAEPSTATKRAKAPSKIQPPSHVDPAVLARFLSSNESFRRLILRARDKDINHIRFTNPFIPLIRFTVGTALQIITAHERRHLQQAARVHSSPNFPR
jgi:hypothetical protein